MERFMLDRLVADLQEAIDAACPNEGVYVGDPANTATWGFHPAEGATEQQIAAGQAVITNVSPQALASYEGPNGSAFKLEDCYKNRRAAYQPSGDQLDALMKGLDAVSAEVTLPQETLDWITACKAVKTQYPKPS